jgi:general secretion pathway protein H
MWSAGRARTARTTRGQRGFTLIEVIVVLGIIAMIAVLAAPQFGSLGPGLKLRATAEELRGDIRRIRNTALRENRETVLLVDLETGSWRDGASRWKGQAPAGTDLALVIARQEQFSDTEGGVRFYPDGSSTGGTVTLSRGDRALRVTVDWFNGSVSIAEPDAQ